MLLIQSAARALWLFVIALACTRGPDSAPAPLSLPVPDSTVPPTAPERGSDDLGLHVVYPAPDDLVQVRDSSFLLGSVASGDVRVTINGMPVKVWPNGAWLAWIPFPPDSVIPFKIEARTDRDSVVLVYPVRRDPRFVPGEARAGQVWIDSVSLSPQGQAWLPADRVPDPLRPSGRGRQCTGVASRGHGGPPASAEATSGSAPCYPRLRA